MALDFKEVTILVAEDNYDVRQIIVQILQVLGVGRVVQAGDGEEAFKKYLKDRPDIVLTDWEMLPVNGLELIKRIRTDEESFDKSIPIIILTGYAAPKRVMAARDSGVTEFLVKPFSAEQLIQRISHVINNPRDFLEAPGYVGPDRRRRTNFDYEEERRGDFDIIMIEADK